MKEIKEFEITGQVVAFTPVPNTITFSLNYECGSAGELYLENNKMMFRGDVDKSARVLFEHVCNMWNVKLGII